MNQQAAQIADLTAQLAGPDTPGESYLEKVGRLSNARSRATEIVTADTAPPVDQDDWEHRFEIWQGGHPIRVLLREFHTSMEEIDDRTPEDPEAEATQSSDSESAKTWLRADLTREGLPTHLIDQCLQPIPVEGTDVTVWRTPAVVETEISSMLRAQWAQLSIETKQDAWDAPSDGADYFQATQRVAAGLPRF
jgi:hypothetical protein